MAKTVQWPAIDPATVAPLRDGKPDLYNHLPTRFITKDEAVARGWTLFYIGESCRWGHVAPRYVSSPRTCIDCHRIHNGRQAIGVKGNKEYSGNLRPYPQREPKSTPGTAVVTTPVVVRQIEPDALERKFLTEYVKEKDFKKAAANCGRHESEFLGRLSFNKIFRDAVHQLELDNGLSRTALLTDDFEWTEDKRKVLMRMYINTGDLTQAMKTIGVSNFHYLKELEENPDFKNDMDEAAELAWKQVEGHAISSAIAGDSRLLQRVLAGNMPEKYGERMKMDINMTQKLTDDQLNAKLAQGLARLEQLGHRIAISGPVVDAEYSVDDAVGEAEVTGDSGSSGSAVSVPSNLDLV